MNGGMVYLIGAGPGDPELLTLKAARALARCDVVLVDDLVHRDVLRLCRPGVRVVEVGKRGGCRSTPQRFIDRLMVRLAKSGATVGRLKAGDPYVFGRGGKVGQIIYWGRPLDWHNQTHPDLLAVRDRLRDVGVAVAGGAAGAAAHTETQKSLAWRFPPGL